MGKHVKILFEIVFSGPPHRDDVEDQSDKLHVRCLVTYIITNIHKKNALTVLRVFRV